MNLLGVYREMLDGDMLESFSTPASGGDVVNLRMYENGSEFLTEAGFRHVVLSANIHRVSEKTGKTLKEWTYNLDSMVAKKDSTNFKNFKV